MIEDPCPNCGHQRKLDMTSTRADAPGFIKLLKGEGDPMMQRIAWLAVILFGALALAMLMANL